LQRIKLETWGLSLAVTQDEDPLLVVTNRNMKLEIYRVNGGKYIRTISGFGQETPLMLYGVK